MPTTFTTFPWHHRRLLSGETATADESTDTGYYVLYFLFVSLVAGAISSGAVRGTRLPYTVSLLFIGLCIGFVHNYADLGVLSKSIDVWVNIGPHTMLSVFLPALVFESGASHTLVPIRPRSRGERRSLRTLPGASLRPGSLAFNPRPRRL
jgi:hypothetical protein